jgi:hypothetical protein
MYRKLGLPSKKNIERYERGEDPILLTNFKTDLEEKFYREFYLNQNYTQI